LGEILQKVKKKIKNSFLFIEIISDEALTILNKIAGRYYHRPAKKKRARVKEILSFRKLKKQMETPPGFGRKGGE